MTTSGTADESTKLLEGRTAIVTGAAQGIGLAIARTLSSSGAAVVIGDVNADAAERAATLLTSEGRAATAVATDVTDEGQVQRCVDIAVETYGQLNIYVNNAGLTRDASMQKMTLDQFRLVIDVHLQGTWLGTRAAAGAMREHGGSIINISSTSGKTGMFGQTNYSAAKAGMIGLTKAAAREVARHGIRVNAIQPGLIRTAMTEALAESIWQQKISEVPLGRAGEPDEIGKVALFLASDLASYVTGTVVEVHGGRFM
jgi:3-oxoacyl-[acyl-carrier protein] reductase